MGMVSRQFVLLSWFIAAVLATAVASWGAPPRHSAPTHRTVAASGGTAPTTSQGPDGVQAAWVMRENQRPGTTAWQINGRPSGTIAGYADRTYAADGDTTALYVSTTAPHWHVEAYRMGYYQGTGARLVWRSPEVASKQQPPCRVESGTNMISCDNWSPGARVPITKAFVPGDYLFKLVGSGGQYSYVPLTVWDPGSHATYLIKNDVLTWQAWNPYGGYDYYVGQGHCPPGVYPLCSRARVVSFDRPYDFSYNGGQGTGDFLALELQLIRWTEQHGLDATYATDITVIDHPHILTAHQAMLSLGHDECWSRRERQAVVAAHQVGVNLAFFGASAILRHVRVQPSSVGPDREEVDYRDPAADPLDGNGDSLDVTGNTWASPPASWPEDDFVGESYNGFLDPTAPPAALRITDADAWIFAGTGLHNGQAIPDVIRSDVDSLQPGLGHPANLEVFAHSPLDTHDAQARTHTGGPFYSDMTYYTDPDGHAGVWDSGTNNWIPDLTPCASGQPCPAPTISAITGNLLRVFGSGPAGTTHPSISNWQALYPHGSP
jgi:hypothetical protein